MVLMLLLYWTTVAFSLELMSLDGAQPSPGVSTPNCDTPQLVGRQCWQPISSRPPASLLPFMPEQTNGSFYCLPSPARSRFSLIPLHPASTGDRYVCHPFSLHFWMRPWYFKIVLSSALSQPSCHGTVDATRMTFLVCSDQITILGLSDVWTIGEKFNFLPESILISHLWAFWRKLALVLLAVQGLAPCPG